MDSSVRRSSVLRVIMNLNFDRFLYALTLAVALGFGAWLGSVIFPV
jgi:hypothetical protein